MSETFTRDEIVKALSHLALTPKGIEIFWDNLATPEPTFEEKYVEQTKSYCKGEMKGAFEFAEQQAHLIASYVSSEIDKLERRIKDLENRPSSYADTLLTPIGPSSIFK